MTVFIGEIACIDPRIQFKTILFNHIVAYICSRFVCVVATQESSHQWNKFLLCDTKPMVQNSAGLDTFVNGGHKLIYQEFDIIDATCRTPPWWFGTSGWVGRIHCLWWQERRRVGGSWKELHILWSSNWRMFVELVLEVNSTLCI